MDKLSYALGLSVAGSLIGSGVKEMNFEKFNKGLRDAMEGKMPEISSEEARQVLNDFFESVQQKASEMNKKAGEDFLNENAKRDEVNVLPSGLQYEVIADGEGNKPSAGDSVKCHYHGTLIDGTVFDSSVQRGEPATFGVNQVIKGWVEALQLMTEGSKWKLYVPSELAYGSQGAGQVIGPDTALVFEVELLEIV
ncbi:FKBP-type peptidyl-prolyl cis-trans isomerase [Saccharicrinis sp. FJH54]|uniref:FKBP-type peptidyl-prolyl cis-trans isomerase n=1 Tax=Saccharicrinis sp. FJH54 TaxID=3344665 RepID=UPI0035D4D26A